MTNWCVSKNGRQKTWSLTNCCAPFPARSGKFDLAYNHFNFTSDPDLIESCVYEISSLQCRYNYLLRRVKERGGSAVIGALPGREV